jgi:two-component system sensor histidine kinase UhpB
VGRLQSLSQRFRQRFQRLPILYRITIGNAAVIAVGAIGGTLITRQLAGQAADWWLIIFFLAAGTLLSVATNFWIFKSALRPLTELSGLVRRLQAGEGEIDPRFLSNTDPDISQLANAIDSLIRQLEERNRQLRALSERSINAQEEERRKIALTLHDETGQALSMLIIHLEQLESQIPATEEAIRSRLKSARQLAKGSLADLRKIVYGLRPTILDDLGLVPAIRWYARTNLEEAGISAQVQSEGEIEPLAPELKSTLFRIAQEAINNVVRHSQAKSARIALNRNDREIRLEIEDDGRGFDVATAAEQALQSQRLGLLGIQERAELVGGKVKLDSIPGKGTRLQVNVPLLIED